MKLLDYAHCNDDTLSLKVIQADTIPVPAVRKPLCEGVDAFGMCEQDATRTFVYHDGSKRQFCSLHHYVEMLWETER